MSQTKTYPDFSKLDTRIQQLEDRGFTHSRVGLRNDVLVSSLLYHQIEEPSDEEWAEFMAELDAKKLAVVNDVVTNNP